MAGRITKRSFENGGAFYSRHLSSIILLALVTIFGKALFIGESVPGLFSGWHLRLGWSGYVRDLFFLISAILILMNLERTFRASEGAIRWQIKLMVLGVGSLFAGRIYTSSQSILFYTMNTALYAFNASALIVAAIFNAISLVHSCLLHVDLCASQTFLYKSLAVLMVGVYLLAVGVLAKVVRCFDVSRNFHLSCGTKIQRSIRSCLFCPRRI